MPLRTCMMVATGYIEGKVVVTTNDYPVINGVGDTLDDAMEQICIALLVHLRGKRTGQPYMMVKAER